MGCGVTRFSVDERATLMRRDAIHVATGRAGILRLCEKLGEVSVRCGQPDAMQDLTYFLSKPGALPRVPHLLVAGSADLTLNEMDPKDIRGFVLIFEQRISGIGTGAFATNDRSGRSTLVSPAEDRTVIAAMAVRELLNRGAHLILMSFRAGGPPTWPWLEPNGRVVARWAMRERTIPGYLSLGTTYDSTLAHVGVRTRRNLRYYRRRAEAELGCVFVPKAEASRDEVLAFSRECMYTVSPEVVAWRYDSLKELAEPLFMGVKDRGGRWLSMLGGRRYLDRSEILWQLNRDGLSNYSLGTVMRAYFLEHEVTHGSRRLYAEGGTPHTMKFSFVPEELTDLAVVRRTVAAKLMRIAASRFISPENELSHIFEANNLEWRPC